MEFANLEKASQFSRLSTQNNILIKKRSDKIYFLKRWIFCIQMSLGNDVSKFWGAYESCDPCTDDFELIKKAYLVKCFSILFLKTKTEGSNTFICRDLSVTITMQHPHAHFV